VTQIITTDEWLVALNLAELPSDDAATILAWGQKLNLSIHRATAWVRFGLAHGLLERATGTVVDLTGRVRRVVGFRLVEHKQDAHDKRKTNRRR
jgi:hypothetical protein